jgi:hypothetical protein
MFFFLPVGLFVDFLVSKIAGPAAFFDLFANFISFFGFSSNSSSSQAFQRAVQFATAQASMQSHSALVNGAGPISFGGFFLGCLHFPVEIFSGFDFLTCGAANTSGRNTRLFKFAI